MHAPLLAFGFVWMVVATLIGMVLGAKHDTHLETLRQYARDGKLAAYNEATEKYQAGATAHGHSFLFAVILVLVAMIVTKLPFAPVITHSIPYVLMCSTTLWTVSALRVIRPLMMVADLVFFLTVITVAFGLVMTAL
jgi:Flp pilus assembly protein TadB